MQAIREKCVECDERAFYEAHDAPRCAIHESRIHTREYDRRHDVRRFVVSFTDFLHNQVIREEWCVNLQGERVNPWGGKEEWARSLKSPTSMDAWYDTNLTTPLSRFDS